MSYWVMWLIVVILLAIIEFATVNLVSIWFVLSGIVAMIVSLFTDLFYIQFGVFVLLGILLMLVTKPALNKMIKENKTKLNLERIIGMEGVVTEQIEKNKVGEVKVDGKLWSAIGNVKIPVDGVVKVKAIDGVKLVVEKVKIEKPKKEKEKAVKKTAAKPKTTTKKTATKKTNTTKKSTNFSKTTKKGS